VAFAGVEPGIFAVFIGLLLLDLALLDDSALVPELSSISLIIGVSTALFLADLVADLVIGPKYPSCRSLLSEGVGDGEITLGVAGICFADDKAIMKGGKQGVRIDPLKIRMILSGTSGKGKSQGEDIEWRCISFLARVLAEAGKDGREVSRGGSAGAGLNCTASLL